MRYSVSKPELETICLMVLRHSLSAVRSVCISVVGAGKDGCNWELMDIEPRPTPSLLEHVMADIQQLQKAFSVDPKSADIGHGGFREMVSSEVH